MRNLFIEFEMQLSSFFVDNFLSQADKTCERRMSSTGLENEYQAMN